MTPQDLSKALGLGLAAGFVAFAVVACGSAGSGPAVSNGPAERSPVEAQQLSYLVVGADQGRLGPDGNRHDAFIVTGPTSVRVGIPVTITITSKDDAQHSMTIPELGINILVPGADNGRDGVVSYTFTPTKTGAFIWFCALPCDTDNNGWDMTADSQGNQPAGFMAGSITVGP